MHNLFSTPVDCVTIVPTAEQFNKTDAFLTRIFDDSQENNWALETGKSTGQHGLDIHDCPEMFWLIDQALVHVREYWNALGYRKPLDIIPDSSWANIHKHLQLTGEHAHCGGFKKSHISTVYHFKKPDNSGHIEFVDPLEYIHRMTPVHEFSERVGTYNEFKTNQFDFVLFPSWLKHRTQANNSIEDRVAISINFIGLF